MTRGLTLLAVATSLACAPVHAPRTAPDPSIAPRSDLAVWREFVQALRAQPLAAGRMKPYQESLREPNQQVLAELRLKADWAEWEREPEVFRVGQQLHYLLPLTFDGHTATYTFSFLVDGDAWYYQHLESIALRLDRLGRLPVSSFPDVPDDLKAWMRAEREATRDVWQYNTLKKEKGREAALAWFRDGAGYALAAHVWTPFVAPERAFILYACWEQARLRGDPVTLERLSDDEAVIRATPAWFRLYRISGHLRGQIPPDEYHALFEDLWRDRAANAGWSVAFSYEGDDVVLPFARRPAGG